MLTGVMVVFAAAFSPIAIMNLVPDSVESYYAFRRADDNVGQLRNKGKQTGRAVRTRLQRR